MNELLINITKDESRVAFLENKILKELYIERTSFSSIVGNIYLGKILRILPSMNAVFVDINEERSAYIDISERSDELSSKLFQGQMLIVQVIKDPIGTKGAKLTTNISLSTVNLVYFPYGSGFRVSKKIEKISQEQLVPIQEEVMNIFKVGGGILRSDSVNANKLLITQEALYLSNLWQEILNKSNGSSPHLLLCEKNLELKIIMELLSTQINRIIIDNKSKYDEIVTWSKKMNLGLDNILSFYERSKPLFEEYGIEKDITLCFYKKVVLKSGVNIVIDRTEAMTVIDVNSGSYIGHKNYSRTALNTNLEAAKEICKQLRLRNIGGIVIIDFIDMLTNDHRKQLLTFLRKEFAKDRAKINVYDFTELGLVQITRKRVRESFLNAIQSECPLCGGVGFIKNMENIFYNLLRELEKIEKENSSEHIIYLAPNFADYIRKNKPTFITDLSFERPSIKVEECTSVEYYGIA